MTNNKKSTARNHVVLTRYIHVHILLLISVHDNLVGFSNRNKSMLYGSIITEANLRNPFNTIHGFPDSDDISC